MLLLDQMLGGLMKQVAPLIRFLAVTQQSLPEIGVDGRQHIVFQRLLVQLAELLAGLVALAGFPEAAGVFVAGGVTHARHCLEQQPGIGESTVGDFDILLLGFFGIGPVLHQAEKSIAKGGTLAPLTPAPLPRSGERGEELLRT